MFLVLLGQCAGIEQQSPNTIIIPININSGSSSSSTFVSINFKSDYFDQKISNRFVVIKNWRPQFQIQIPVTFTGQQIAHPHPLSTIPGFPPAVTTSPALGLLLLLHWHCPCPGESPKSRHCSWSAPLAAQLRHLPVAFQTGFYGRMEGQKE